MIWVCFGFFSFKNLTLVDPPERVDRFLVLYILKTVNHGVTLVP